MEKGDALFAQMSYPAAIEAYGKAVEAEPTNAEAVTRLADCYRLTDDYRMAMRWYARAVKMKHVSEDAWFRYGEVLMVNRKYEEAVPWLEKYQKAHPSDDRVADMLESCADQARFSSGKDLYTLRRLPMVNSEASDFGPTILGDAVIFASARKRSLVKYNRTGESFLDFYTASYVGKAQLGEPTLFRSGHNTPLHEANACFSADGKEMFFTRNNVIKGAAAAGKDDVVNLALYHAHFVEGKWEDGEKLPFNSDAYSCGHPALSPDGSKLYFVSSQPGGFGGTDIYVVERKGDAWGEPENLGQDINTKGNEMFPWLDGQGMLYFATNGRGGLGGLDLFVVDPNPEVVGDPQHLGEPVNSTYDDFGFVLDEKNGVGFFTSNRPGGKGDDDLYAVTRLSRWEGMVQDSSGNPLAGAVVELREGQSRNVVTTDESGGFVFGIQPGNNYLLLYKAPGYAERSRHVLGEDLLQEMKAKGGRSLLGWD